MRWQGLLLAVTMGQHAQQRQLTVLVDAPKSGNGPAAHLSRQQHTRLIVMHHYQASLNAARVQRGVSASLRATHTAGGPRQRQSLCLADLHSQLSVSLAKQQHSMRRLTAKHASGAPTSWHCMAQQWLHNESMCMHTAACRQDRQLVRACMQAHVQAQAQMCAGVSI